MKKKHGWYDWFCIRIRLYSSRQAFAACRAFDIWIRQHGFSFLHSAQLIIFPVHSNIGFTEKLVRAAKCKSAGNDELPSMFTAELRSNTKWLCSSCRRPADRSLFSSSSFHCWRPRGRGPGGRERGVGAAAAWETQVFHARLWPKLLQSGRREEQPAANRTEAPPSSGKPSARLSNQGEICKDCKMILQIIKIHPWSHSQRIVLNCVEKENIVG